MNFEKQQDFLNITKNGEGCNCGQESNSELSKSNHGQAAQTARNEKQSGAC